MKRWGKWLALVVVLLVVAGGLLRVLSARKAQQEALAAATAARAQTVIELAASDVVRARSQVLSQGVPISGTLKAVSTAVVKARVAGELQGLTVREGDTVRAGQIIARVDATEYRSRLAQVQQQADSAKSQIDIAQRQWDNNKALVDQGFISRTALDNSLNNLSAAQANYKAALAAVDVARKSVDDTVLRAPISGQVSQRLAQPGERVGIDARVVEIVDPSRLELEATLAAADSLGLRVGQTAVLAVEGPANGTANAAGAAPGIMARVVRVNPSAQAGSRSVLVYLAIASGTDGNAGAAALRHGLFAQGTLATGRTEALAVPLTVVRTDKPAPYVQAIENNQVVHKPVTTGARGTDEQDPRGELLVAVQGLAADAVVIRGNIGTVREGTTVKFTAPLAAATPPVGAPPPGAASARGTP